MMRRFFIHNALICLLLFVGLLLAPQFAAANPQALMVSSGKDTGNDTDTSQDSIGSKSAEGIVAELSDEQVRRMLIDELRKQSVSADETASPEEVGGLAGLIGKIRFLANEIQWRIYTLKNDSGMDPDEMPRLFHLLRKDESQTKPDAFKTIMSVIGLLAGSLIIYGLFRRSLAAAYGRIEGVTDPSGKTKVGGLLLRALLDSLCMLVFAIAALVIFFLFMQRTGPQSVLVATYVAAFLIVMGVQVVLRFFLVPKKPVLRFLPLEDHTAKYLYRWIVAIAVVISFGFLTCGIFRLAGSSEANHLLMIAVLKMVVIGMIITMILQKRQQVKQTLIKDLPDTKLLYHLAGNWHLLAIVAALMLLVVSTFNLFLFGIRPGLPGVQTLIIIPLYFLFDWVLRQILRVLFGIAKRPENMRAPWVSVDQEDLPDEADAVEPKLASQTSPLPATATHEEEPADEEEPEPPVKKYLDVHRLNRIVGGGLRLALAAFAFFYLLKIWGIEIQFGIAVIRTALSLLIVLLICYVTWEIISAAIQRRLEEEMPETDEDMEEGGAGGSRMGTLLLLLRKFLFAVISVMVTLIMLSSIGVDIGPLIAGAGVVGLAIGFGAQTLVKDIIAGVFFLVDDAFRVGDYIEAGGTKGMVEQISLRSLRLRHPRGMVNTIPFGDIGIVTNMSRDYIITKLDFRVRYDTDVEQVRKIIKKKVYMPIMANEEMGPKLLDKIKSQGVREMDDSAMIMRVKFKTIPGQQFIIRKEVYRLMQEAFQEAGIEFAHRNVTVYMPPDPSDEASEDTPDGKTETTPTPDRTVMERAAAAAAIAADQANAKAEEPQKP